MQSFVIMVDPNRKINRLSDEDASFLVECEQEFRSRYTDADKEFKQYKEKPDALPPIIEPWNTNKRNHDGGNNWNRNQSHRSNYSGFHRKNYNNRNNDNNRGYKQHRYQHNPYNQN